MRGIRLIAFTYTSGTLMLDGNGNDVWSAQCSIFRLRHDNGMQCLSRPVGAWVQAPICTHDLNGEDAPLNPRDYRLSR